MTDPEKKICRYFNTLGGCWYGDSCKFLHIPNKKPPCKFYGSSTGCRYGESCHFSHDRAPFKSVENYNNPSSEIIKEVFKENVDPTGLSGTNNNNMTQPMTNLLNNTGQAGLISNAVDGKTLTDYPNSNAHLPTECTRTLTDGEESTEKSEFKALVVHPDYTNVCETPLGVETLASDMPGSLLDATNNNSNTDGELKVNQETVYQDIPGTQATTLLEDGQNYAVATVNGRMNGMLMTNEMELFCGSCKRVVERRGNESYCTLLKDHYLECFLDKEGDHVKYVKTKAALEPGQMYWCKSCILIFEKPWSLFQHMADKAKGCKVQRWEKKIHLDWMDNVAGLMAGYDLGLFSPAKLRIDLRNLLADQHTMEEEMEVAAVTAAAMMQWLSPLSNPWRLQQREMMRKIEQLNRQMLRKANMSLNAGYPMRAALTAASGAMTSSSSVSYSRNETQPSSANGLQANNASTYHGASADDELSSQTPVVEEADGKNNDVVKSDAIVGPLGDGNSSVCLNESSNIVDKMGASGDDLTDSNREKTPTNLSEDKFDETVGFNNTDSAQTRTQRADAKEDFSRKVDYKRGYHSAPAYGYNKSAHVMGLGPHYRAFKDSMRYQLHPRGSRTPGYGHFNGGIHRTQSHRSNRGPSSSNAPMNRGTNAFNPPSFHASMDFNCGFTDAEVEELLSQGINPWDSEAPAALAVLRGELDHLLD